MISDVPIAFTNGEKKPSVLMFFFKYKNPPKSSNFQTYILFFKELKLYWSVKLEKGKKKKLK